MLYNGGGQGTGLMWDPSRSNAKVELISNLQPHNFGSTSLQAWNLRYTADAAVAQSLLRQDSTTGCLYFTKQMSQDTPQFLSVYQNMTAISRAGQYSNGYDQIVTIKYTSGGREFTLTSHY